MNSIGGRDQGGIMDCNKIYLKMDRYETVVFCNDDVNVYVLCSKAEGKAIYIDSGEMER